MSDLFFYVISSCCTWQWQWRYDNTNKCNISLHSILKEGERSWLSVPAEKGYGAQEMGTPNGGGFYIPANSDLLFDIEILGKEGEQDL